MPMPMPLRRTRLLLPAVVSSLLAWGPALAQEGASAPQKTAPAKPGAVKPADGKKKSGVDLRGLKLPSLGAVPKADGVAVVPASGSTLPQGTRTLAGARYTVEGVVHAAGFTSAASGPRPQGAPFAAVTLEGQPRQTPRFSSLVRVRSPARAGASIEVALVDAAGATVMETSGTLAFGAGELTTFQVDWEPTAVRRAGAFQVLVRVAGEPLGTWPLEVREARATP